jgi:hypothetical protein
MLKMNERDRFMPDPNRIGLVTSTVLLAMALARLLPSGVRSRGATARLPAALPLDVTGLMSILTAGLAATGMDWLLRGHPSLKGTGHVSVVVPAHADNLCHQRTALHPARGTGLVGRIPRQRRVHLLRLPRRIRGGGPGFPQYTLSVAGLTAISYTLFFVLSIALRASDMRLFILLPALFIAAALASLRILHLWMGGRWELAWSLGIGLVTVQLAAGLHYWPSRPFNLVCC